MPKGMQNRRPQLLEMHATLVNVPEGADVLQFLNSAADDAGYAPSIILSGVGLLSKAVLYVANDEAIPEVPDIEKNMSIKPDFDGTKYPELHDLPRIRIDEATEYGISEDVDFPELRSPPHWYSRQVFDHPLSILYARGGRSSTHWHISITLQCPDAPKEISVELIALSGKYCLDVLPEVPSSLSSVYLRI
ncbi:hypothetical protein BWQ96_05843 [Gracilariopsis chorda]|uniref:Uncharacterized protein n=1 Tax=Gracilariopsis chorda TaxID=448386 RepID=A0A2V3ITF9_9FLOR|nr:hypothetical protein BWQ96_05843 [Gracilariopsis chorda]|eukprot:PXF44400.1 hypothetical protein BWQ96_05843 [Gracilariopsis chorda]